MGTSGGSLWSLQTGADHSGCWRVDKCYIHTLCAVLQADDLSESLRPWLAEQLTCNTMEKKRLKSAATCQFHFKLQAKDHFKQQGSNRFVFTGKFYFV